MRLLLRRGADPTATDTNGNSARDWALHQVKGHGKDPVLRETRSTATSALRRTCVDLLDLASRPWCRANHATFPDAERQLVKSMVWLGCALAKRLRMRSQEFADVWEAHVMPLLVVRPRCCNRRWQTDASKVGICMVAPHSTIVWDRRPRAEFHMLLLAEAELPRQQYLPATMETIDQLAALQSDATNAVRFFAARAPIADASAARIVVRADAIDPRLCVHLVMGRLLPEVAASHFDWPRYVPLSDVIARLLDELDRV